MIPTPERVRFKAALRIHERYEALFRQRFPRTLELPLDPWQRLQRLRRQARLCHAHGLPQAGQQVQEQASLELHRMARCCEQLAESLQRQNSAPSCSLILAELLALEQEFESVQFDLQHHTLSVQTEPILLDGIDLGPFEIRLDYASLGNVSPYDVVSLEPRPSACSSDTVHPHVLGRTLCEGDGQRAIQAALDQGRLFDLFLLISQILRTYNPGSAYVPLCDWDGVACAACDDLVPESDLSECDQCRTTLCRDCRHACDGCRDVLCADCQTECGTCSDRFCESCLSPCSACGQSCCDACLDDGRCPDCLPDPDPDQELFTDDYDPPSEDLTSADATVASAVGCSPLASTSAPTPTPTPTKAVPPAPIDVLPDRLGAAAVPA